MRTAEPIAHIFRYSADVPWIDRTQVRVAELALDHVPYDSGAEEIRRQPP